MKNIKWMELQNAVKKLPFPPPYVLKNICEKEDDYHKFDTDINYLGDWSNEVLNINLLIRVLK